MEAADVELWPFQAFAKDDEDRGALRKTDT